VNKKGPQATHLRPSKRDYYPPEDDKTITAASDKRPRSNNKGSSAFIFFLLSFLLTSLILQILKILLNCAHSTERFATRLQQRVNHKRRAGRYNST